jgi:hypothetical protein
MRWFVGAMGATALLAAAGVGRADEARARVITLECTAPAPPPPRGGTLHLVCKVKGDAAVVAVALDPATGPAPRWETLDPFARSRDTALDRLDWETRSTLVDPFEPSGRSLPDPFLPDSEASDEP